MYTTERAKEILKTEGVSFSESRFPYTYHHDRVRQCTTGPNFGRGEVAGLLRQKYSDTLIYDAVCVAGAILFLAGNGDGTGLNFSMGLATNEEFRKMFLWAVTYYGKHGLKTEDFKYNG
jgi:hypothetical protein